MFPPPFVQVSFEIPVDVTQFLVSQQGLVFCKRCVTHELEATVSREAGAGPARRLSITQYWFLRAGGLEVWAVSVCSRVLGPAQGGKEEKNGTPQQWRSAERHCICGELEVGICTQQIAGASCSPVVLFAKPTLLNYGRTCGKSKSKLLALSGNNTDLHCITSHHVKYPAKFMFHKERVTDSAIMSAQTWGGGAAVIFGISVI